MCAEDASQHVASDSGSYGAGHVGALYLQEDSPDALIAEFKAVLHQGAIEAQRAAQSDRS